MDAKKRILFVDDEDVIRALCGRILTRMGYEMVGVGSVQEARDKIRKLGLVDLLIADMRLPDGDGVDVISYFRQKHPESKVLVVTGSPSPDSDTGRLQRMGFNETDILWKPFDVKDFESKVHRCLGGEKP